MKKEKKINPNDAFLYSEISSIPIIQAQLELKEGKSPYAEINQAREWLELAIKNNSADSAAHSRKGQTYLIEAQWALSNKRNPQQLLSMAKISYQNAIKSNPDETSAYIGLAEYCYWSARSKSTNAPLVEGLKYIDEAIRVNSSSAEAYGMQGKLLQMKSDIQKNPQEKEQAALGAQEAFRKAISLNKNLSNLYSPYLSLRTN